MSSTPAQDQKDRHGLVFTFYSFKGGVGRSMAAANVAEWCRLLGLRVVMIDWDLEAPGLETFFFPPGNRMGDEPSPLDRIRSQLGLIDMLESYRRQFPTMLRPAQATPAEWLALLDRELPSVTALLQPIGAPATGDGAGLWLLPAGWRAGEQFSSYARLVQGFDWTDFYSSFEGEAYFAWLRAALTRFADVVIIDSRTGVTEMGGVCAQWLADVVVAFCAPNEQNLDGIDTMVTAFLREELGAQRGRAIEVVVVPTRLDNAETDLQNQFKRQFERQFSGLLQRSGLRPSLEVLPNAKRTFWDLKIPYIAKYAYREKLTVGAADKNDDLEEAYKRLAAHLALLAPEGGLVRRAFAPEIERFFPKLLPKVYLSYAFADRAAATHLTKLLEVAGITVGLPIEAWNDPGLADEKAATARVAAVLDQVSALILVLGATTLDRPWVRWELRRAQEKGINIYLVAPAGIEAQPASLPPELRSRRIYRLEPEVDGELHELAQAVRQPAPVRRIPFQAPPPPVRAVHHPRLAELQVAVLRPSHRHVVLAGPGGSGKSVLAAMLCESDEIIAAFPDGICWFTCGAVPNLAAEFGKTYEALTGAAPESLTVAELAVRLKKEFQTRRCLLVVDDVPGTRELGLFLLGGPGCVHLITSRQSSLRVEAEVVLLSDFAEPQAVELLLTQARLPEELSEEVRSLVEKLGRNPLAITLAAGAIRQRQAAGDSPMAALATIAALLERQGVGALDQAGAEGPSGIGETITFSLDQLAPAERELLYLLAGHRAGQPIPLESARVSWGLRDAQEAERLALRLHSLSLIRYEATTQQLEIPAVLHSYIVGQRLAPKSAPPELPRAAEPIRRSQPREQTADAEQARRILRGQRAETGELRKLARRLRGARRYSYARRLLAVARTELPADADSALCLALAQEHALATYQDPDLPAEARYAEALRILQSAADLASTTDQETLGQAGAIYKCWWALDQQKARLETSAAYYRRGYDAGLTGRSGFDGFSYTAINAAFVLDLLAQQEERAAAQAGSAPPEVARKHRAEARGIRERILAEYAALTEPAKGWWIVVTLAEACFGLRRYDQAESWLKEAALLEVADWERQTTARQLATLARLQEAAGAGETAGPSPSQRVGALLRIFLGNDTAAVRSAFTGKVGLALSGGGFRASLFHIGVLARMAELDLLRRLEALSCVSGGSIVGAHYYLELQRLLQEKPDEAITREDYLEIVRRLARDFLAGVQKNLRTQVAAHLPTSLRMIFQPHFSRTVRLGELYEDLLFSRVEDGREKHAPRYMDELFVRPHGGPDDFLPKLDNWRRLAKVPELVLNATALNTGHAWQFTASWMGEPPGLIDTEIDGNDRLRRLYYWQAPEPHQRVRLGLAVAASSCVPGLFEPVALGGLYPERTVRLVDGGVHDNQGIGSLIEQDCDVLLVSDASGQSASEANPRTGLLSVSGRVNGLLMARVRESQHHELRARRRASLLRGFMFLHLKKDLTVDPVDWHGCEDPQEVSDPLARARRSAADVTTYGIPNEIQERLAAVRTDLDSFSDQEAFALMVSGYRMAEADLARLGKEIPDLIEDDGMREPWPFLEIERAMHHSGGRAEARQSLLRSLRAASRRALKVWYVAPVQAALVVLVPSAFVFQGLSHWGPKGSDVFLALFLGFWAAALLAVVGLLVALLSRLFTRCGKTVAEVFLGTLVLMLGWLPALLHLWIFDRLFLAAGRLKSDAQPRSPGPPPASPAVSRHESGPTEAR